MGRLNKVVEDLVAFKAGGIRRLSIPEEPIVRKASRKVVKTLGEGAQAKPPKDPEFWVAFAEKVDAEGQWDSVTKAELKNIGKCLWYGESYLAKDEGFVSRYLTAAEKCNRKTLYRTIIWSYLFYYGEGKLGILQVASWLDSIVAQAEWDKRWGQRQVDFNIFSAEASQNIAEGVFEVRGSANTVLEKAGLGGNLRAGGMGQAAFKALLTKYRTSAGDLHPEDTLTLLNKLLTWAKGNHTEFVFSEINSYFIECLLLPWETELPAEEIQKKTQNYLIGVFDDPRTKNWPVDDTTQQIIRSWLVGKSLGQFIEIIDDMALDHHWKYRQAFWMAYYEKGYIKDAWVVFAPDGADCAQRNARLKEDPSWLSFGKLSRWNDRKHAILLLKVGDITIADYSHMGPCRIWKSNNAKAPQLYKKTYGKAEFTRAFPDVEESHFHSDTFWWQDKISREIFRFTGVRLSQQDYSP